MALFTKITGLAYGELELLITLLSRHSCRMSAIILRSAIEVRNGFDLTGALTGNSGMSISSTLVHPNSPRFLAKTSRYSLINATNCCRSYSLAPFPIVISCTLIGSRFLMLRPLCWMRSSRSPGICRPVNWFACQSY